jgi:hypothetical protein
LATLSTQVEAIVLADIISIYYNSHRKILDLRIGDPSIHPLPASHFGFAPFLAALELLMSRCGPHITLIFSTAFLTIFILIVVITAVPKDIPHQANIGQGPKAESSPATLDPSPHGQYHQVER